MSAFEVRVSAARMITPVIRELSLEALNGTLPSFSAGSHVQLHLPNGRRNAYSLISDPSDTRHYRIAVRRQAQSRGGSRYVHEQLQAGDRLNISPPANLFALHSTARLHILVAAGIGITPFLAHSAELLRRGEAFELHYAYRAGVSDAYVETLRERLGERLHVYESSHHRLDLTQLLSHRPLGTHVYACGPQALLEALREQSLALGWPPARLHWEAFTAPQPGEPFRVELVRSGRQLEVAAEQSLLEALEAAGVELPNLCRGGVCGQCRTPYLQGDVQHRDLFLASDERASSLMPCVSRGCGSPILLDI
ncbi:PDR/VanB family oxidoreductase [Pseudomonas sp. DTU_2021_1001937_2_SI_NGA_ILE_001]|uniref:PDR/VanB family oxidoreductase n=1 Tax=Pseudomonas sp. DTU_2021_1001937_2_SI_NGA_ILE_001 TaxID=3077589 RepID=UPI0028FC2005|nr:PDR/VanB family oxidoreductase [Pseudomonas sp. DTU_2021_1001937_2_SI_NGA_ILE_001]WNW10572.1 PDR/VanB family oxidoreductase [Pseudomonas sp. DTU_2021_1001937_2_SI_NGA_ILE_001]